MNRLSFFAVALLLLVDGSFAQLFQKAGHCPMRHTVACSGRCMSDGECLGNTKCCPNKCGWTSCVQSGVINTGSDGGYKGSSNQAVYCNGVRCALGEKCRYDRTTRREKCLRDY